MKTNQQNQDYYFLKKSIKNNQSILKSYVNEVLISERTIIDYLRLYRNAKFEGNRKLTDFLKKEINWWRIQLADAKKEIEFYKKNIEKKRNEMLLISDKNTQE
jgi:hypothetical protein